MAKMTLKEMREAKGLSRLDVMRMSKVQINHNSIHQWEVGKSAPSGKTLQELMILYDQDLRDVLFVTSDKRVQ